jgi:hypothetical protein
VWVLHDRHITEFAGGFAEWEEVSREREHAAAVRSKEEESLRRVHERQKLAKKRAAEPQPRSSKDARRDQRKARREIETVEAKITQLEARVAELSSLLEDPGLYTRAGGVEQAQRLGDALESVKVELEQSFAHWTQLADPAAGSS